MEGEQTSAISTFVTGMALGVLTIFLYQKLKPKQKTINDTLAGMSLDLSQSIKQAADRDMSAKELYAELLKKEGEAPTDKKKPTPDKTQL